MIIDTLAFESPMRSKLILELFHFILNLLKSHKALETLEIIEDERLFDLICKCIHIPGTEMVLLFLNLINEIFFLHQNNSASLSVDILFLFESNGTLDSLEKLQFHTNQEVYKLSQCIIENFFSDNDPFDHNGLVDSNLKDFGKCDFNF